MAPVGFLSPAARDRLTALPSFGCGGTAAKSERLPRYISAKALYTSATEFAKGLSAKIVTYSNMSPCQSSFVVGYETSSYIHV